MGIKKEQYQEWLQFCEMVQSETPVIATETEDQKQKRIKMLLGDYRKFFAYYFPMYAKTESAKFHVKLANKVLKTPRLRAVFEAFRGAAKSVHATIGIPFWLMVKGEMKTMLLVGETEDKADLLLSGIQAMLENNQRIIADYGEQARWGSWEEGKFITKDNVCFLALGLGQSPRGARNGQHRPDYIVCDDLDTKERCKNPKRVREAVEWVMDDLMGCFDIGNERFILCNNRIHKTSILTGVLAALKKAKGFFHLKVNALDGRGRPTWPEKYTKEYWAEKKADTPLRSWEREYMNNPIEEGTIFKKQWLHFTKPLKLSRYDSLTAYADPSFKSSSKNDYKAVSLIGRVGHEIHLLACFVRQCSIGEMVKWFYDLDQEKDEKAVINYWMEANFIQDLLLDEFVNEGRKRGYQLPIRADKRKKPDKFQRIENLSPLFERGLVRISSKLEDDPDFTQFEEQLLAFEKGSSSADDAPDSFEGAVSVSRALSISKQKPVLGKRRGNNKRF